MESHNIARSLKGHAATAGVDKWVLIQENTFRNWVNEQLRSFDMSVSNLEEDFDDGIRMCALIESLQGKRIRVIKNPKNHHQQLANVGEALTAIANDNIRLVNIGPEDIVNGNLKLILGLIWHLILRYQIGKSKFPTKKLMLAWLKAVIPDRNIENFTSDWNDGISLFALIDYCRPGLCPDWRHLSRSDRLDNCRNAMTLAKQHFDIPLVVRPEDLSSSDLDELSGMTYLSYFMKLDSPGYHATLNMVRKLLRSGTVDNFTSDWSDGRLLCNLVTSVGGHVTGWPLMTGEAVENMQSGIDGAKGLSITSILNAKQMTDPEVDHIGIMAFAACFNSFKPVRTSAEKVLFSSLPSGVSVGQQAHFTIHLEDEDVSAGDIRADVQGPDTTHTVHFNWVGRTGEGYFTPTEIGLHRLNVYCEGQTINGCPASFKVLADRSKVSFSSIERCTLGHLTELQINSSAAGQGEVRIEARAPSGRSLTLTPVPRHGNYVTNFNPTEVGEWEISVIYDDDHIEGSPYVINVFDPAQVKVYGLEGGTVGTGLTFNADTTRAGKGDIRVKVTHNGSYVDNHVIEENDGLYKIDFTPQGSGVYSVTVFYNDTEIRGSPYSLDIVDSSNVSVSGDGLSLVPVSQTASFEVDTHGASGGKVEVEVTSPSGSRVPANLKKLPNGSTKVEYIPTTSGDHQITVFYCGQKVKGCPFLARVYDASKVLVSHMPSSGVIGNAIVFDIDASRAGSGNIEIMVNDGKIACSVQNHGNYKFTASFIPTAAVEHTVEMKFNSMAVQGSPWKVAILDPGKMTATGSGLGFVHVNRLAAFSVAPDGDSMTANVIQGTSEYNVTYMPTQVGDYTIHIKYADHEVSGSPFIAKSYDTSAIDVSPPPDGIMGQPIEFGIDVTKAGEGQLEIMVNNGNLPNTVESDVTGVYKMSFVPDTTGQQTVDIIFNKEHHPGSPFICNAIDLNVASVRNLDLQLPVDKATSFHIHSEAIGQDLAANVDVYSPGGKDVAVSYKKDGPGVQRIQFTPREAGVHTVNVTYLGHHLEGSPMYVRTYSPALVQLSKMPLGILDIPFKFRVLAEQAGDGDVEVEVTAGGDTIPCDIDPLGDGSFEVTFMGDGERQHRLDIMFNGEHIPVSPVHINFADVDKIRVKKPQVELVRCHHPFTLKLTSAETAIDDLCIKMIGPYYDVVPTKLCTIGDRFYHLNFTPKVAGTYDLDIQYGNVIPIWGSPMKIKAYDSTKVKVLPSADKPRLGERYQMSVDVSEAGQGDLAIVVLCNGETVQTSVSHENDGLIWSSFEPEQSKRHDIYMTYNGEPVPAPNGDRVMAEVFSQGHGDYKVEWLPRVPGRHTVSVSFSGREIEGSPFHVDVFDLASIRVDNFRNGDVNDEAGFSVDFSSSGTLDHEIRVVSPSGRDVIFDSRDLGYLCKDYIYDADETGKYKIYIRYGGFDLPGCPFTQEISDGGMPTASGGGLYSSEEDKPANFNVDVGRRKGDLRVSVSGPNSIAKCSVEPLADGSYTVTYIPVEVGIFDISVTWNGDDIPGSPYHPKVLDARKVKIVGGWQHYMDGGERINLVVGERKSLPFDISVAGPGSLRAEVSGPSRALHVEMDNHTMGTSVIIFTPEEEGTHYINIFWSELPLVNSPFHGYAIHQTVDANKLILTGRGLKEAVVREESEFTIDGSQAGPGTPEVILSGVRAEVNVKVIAIGNGKFKCSYIPVVPGAYLLHITWNGRQLRGSPYKVNVIGAFYPNKVLVNWDALRGGILGSEMSIVIDSRKAGPGELTAYCMGPHQASYCELEDNRDGTFRLRVKPQELGRHVMQIKYGGEHVQGSPFVLKVTGQPDASKVRVTGPGVEHGILANFISKFVVDTRGAGAGQLTVRIRGPKGGFQVEMYRDSQKDRTILCHYDPRECGLYIIAIKWSGVDVPGSPFSVHILDTQQELEHVLGNDVSYSINSHHGSQNTPRLAYAQWRDNV